MGRPDPTYFLRATDGPNSNGSGWSVLPPLNMRIKIKFYFANKDKVFKFKLISSFLFVMLQNHKSTKNIIILAISNNICFQYL